LEERFTIPSRQSPFAVILIAYKTLKVAFRQFWPLILLVLASSNKLSIGIAAVALLIISLLFVMFSVWSYMNFYFHVDEDELFISKGVIKKSKLSVRFTKVQSINMEQKLIHQALNIVSLKIDTAGSKGEEFEISALSKSDAKALRNLILSQKKELIANDDGVIMDEVPEEERMIFRLSVPDLMKVGISQNHINTALVILAFGLGLTDEIESVFKFRPEEYIEDYVVGAGFDQWKIILASIPFFLLIAFIITMFRTSLKFYNLRVLRTGNGFKLKSGLLNRKEQSALLQKIQVVRWFTGPVKRLFGMNTLRLFQASSVEVQQNKAIIIPGCYDYQIEAFNRDIFNREFTEGRYRLRPHISLFWRRSLFIGFLPLMGLIPMAYLMVGDLAWTLLLWVPVIIFSQYVYQQKFILETDSRMIRIKSGIIRDHSAMFEIYKLQGLDLSQTIFQRRHNLANLTFFTATGQVNAPYLPLHEAKELYDYCLFLMEKSKRRWM